MKTKSVWTLTFFSSKSAFGTKETAGMIGCTLPASQQHYQTGEHFLEEGLQQFTPCRVIELLFVVEQKPVQNHTSESCSL